MQNLLILFVVLYLSGAEEPQVRTKYGTVVGKEVEVHGKKLQVYKGIPFATPPVGDLRFRRPQPVKPWNGVLKAQEFSKRCFMYSDEVPTLDILPEMSEDCLYLNIWVPPGADKESKAVMFFVYGGYFSIGTAALPFYTGEHLSSLGDVIVVTFNYRLGLIGYAYSGSTDAPGNAGTYDTIEALKWTNENIEAFGGDTKRITVFGESAGAVTVSMFAISPLTRNLFTRGIPMSDVLTAIVRKDGNDNLERTQTIAKNVSCAMGVRDICIRPGRVMKCLRGEDPLRLVKVDFYTVPTSRAHYVPQYGNEFLQTDPLLATFRGQFKDSELFIGITKDEMSYFLAIYFPEYFGNHGEKDTKVDKDLAKKIMETIFRDFQKQGSMENIFDYYLGPIADDDYNQIRNQVAVAVSDYIVICPSVYIAEEYAKKGNNVYFYVYSHRSGNSPHAPWMGVVHFDEIFFMFGMPLDKNAKAHFTDEERRLSQDMISAWTNFAKYGKPRVNGSESWPLYSQDNRKFVSFETGSNHIMSGPHTDNCRFLKKEYNFGNVKPFCCKKPSPNCVLDDVNSVSHLDDNSVL